MSDAIISRPVLRGDHLLLRPPQPSDKQDRLAYGRDPEFRKMVGGDGRTCPPLTAAEVEYWYQEVDSDPFGWIIAWEGRCVGTARLHAFDEPNRRARYAIGLFSPLHRGRGIGTEATRFVLSYAFDVLHLHRVELRVLTFNHRAIACYERCGFVREGIEREGAWIGGQWCSDVLMSILEQEYRQVCIGWSKPSLL